MRLQFIKVICLLALLTAACSRNSMSGSSSGVKSELGAVGDLQVADNFSQYQAKTAHCSSTGSGYRILVTGFGLYLGAAYNASGMIVDSFADPSFTPDTLSIVDPSVDDVHQFKGSTLAQGNPGTGIVSASDHGGKAAQRQFTVNTVPVINYDVCFLTLDVIWDQAAAIILQEATVFKPDLILLTGLNSPSKNWAEFEVGAYNQSQNTDGYNSDGSLDAANEPQTPYIMAGAPAQLSYSWNNQATADAQKALFAKIPSDYKSPQTPISNNIYLCNEVGYVTQAAAFGLPISLAGGKITNSGSNQDMNIHIPAQTQIGFMHLPPTIQQDKASVTAWVNLELSVINTALTSGLE